MKSFNATPPEELEGPTSITFEIGWEHTVSEDGVLALVRDGAGQPVPRSYTVPARVTAAQMLDAVRIIGPDRLAELTRDGGLDSVVEIVGAVVGQDLVLGIAADPTVETEAFIELLLELAATLGLDEVVETPDPTTAPSGASSDS